jgi:hypothetical protein
MQQTQPNDTLITFRQQVRSASEPVLSTVTELVHTYIWEKPEHIYLMLGFYYLNLLLDLLLYYRKGRLTALLVRQKIVRTLMESAGGLILLFVGTASAQISSAFFWMPQLVMAVLLATLILRIGKRLSLLGWITPTIYQTIDRKISTQLKEMSHERTTDPLLEPDKETH